MYTGRKNAQRMLIFLLVYQLGYASLHTIITSKCEHLMRLPNQHNAYFHNHKLCCMCPAGFFLAKDCRHHSPSSTVCEECHYNKTDPNDRYQILYGPHMLRKCEWQYPVRCQRDEIYVEGSTSKEPKCVPKPKEMEPRALVTTTVNSVLTRVSQPTTQEDTSYNEQSSKSDIDLPFTPPIDPNQGVNDARGDATHSQGSSVVNDEIETTAHPTVSTTQDISETTVIYGKNMYTFGSWIFFFIVTTPLGLIFGAVLAIWLCRRQISREQDTVIPLQERKNDDQRTDFVVKVEGNIGRVEGQSSSGSSGLLGAGPLEINTEAGNTVPEEQSFLGAVDREEGRSSGQVPEAAEEARQPLLRPANNSSHPRLRNVQRNRDSNMLLIMKIARIFPDCVTRKQVLPIFRIILGTGHESFFDDMDRIYQDNTPEFIVQLILYCTRILGNKCTPEFLQQNLVEMPENIRPVMLVERIGKIIDESRLQL